MDVARPDLRNLKIQKAPAQRRLASHHLDIRAGERDRVELADEVDQPVLADTMDPHLLELSPADGDLQRHIRTPLPDHDAGICRELSVKSNQILVPRAAERLRRCQQANRFQEVGLALGIGAYDDIQGGGEPCGKRGIVPIMP